VTGLQRCHQRRLVHQRRTGRVDQHGAFFHLCQLGCPQQPSGLCGHGGMEADYIAARQEFRQAHEFSVHQRRLFGRHMRVGHQ